MCSRVLRHEGRKRSHGPGGGPIAGDPTPFDADALEKSFPVHQADEAVPVRCQEVPKTDWSVRGRECDEPVSAFPQREQQNILKVIKILLSR